MPGSDLPGRRSAMSRQAVPFAVPDLAAFARALGAALTERHARKPEPPGHVEMLNLLARAAGHRNIQALRAAVPIATTAAPATPATPAANAAKTLTDNARKALGQFDDAGRLMRWPVKYSVQRLVMWTMWSRFDAKRSYTEPEVNAVLKDAQTFGDHVTLRRELINHRLMSRERDCTDYRKLPVRPDDEARALLAAWRAKLRAI
jgi:hypothetical protein